MNTRDALVFTTAASAGSLSEAARRLGMTPMAASRRLAALETALGVRVMYRTTRSLALTPEGETFLPYAQAMVAGEEEARALLRGTGQGAAGLLRVSVPAVFGRKVVSPLIPGLLAENPDLRIALELDDTMPDLVAEGIDLAIRLAHLKDSRLIARKLADGPRRLVAAPSYLARRPPPRRLEDLASHDCLPMTGITHWLFHVDGGQERRLRLSPRFSSNSIEGCHAVCLAGGGIAVFAEWNTASDIQAGHLVPIDIPGAIPDSRPIWAVTPNNQRILPKVRVFIAAVEAALA